MDHPAVRESLAFDHPYRFLIHDRDSIFSESIDGELKGFGVRVLKTPARAPQANAFCERLIGTIRRECLDWIIPFCESHLKRSSASSSCITIAAALTRRSDLEFRSRRKPRFRQVRTATRYPRVTA